MKSQNRVQIWCWLNVINFDRNYNKCQYTKNIPLPKCKKYSSVYRFVQIRGANRFPTADRVSPAVDRLCQEYRKKIMKKLPSKNKLTNYEILKKNHGGPVRAALFHMDPMDKVIWPLKWKNHIVSCITHFQLCCPNSAKKTHRSLLAIRS